MLSSAPLRARSQRRPHVLPTWPEPNPESRPPTLPPAWGPASISTGSASRPALCSQNADFPGAVARKVCEPYLEILARAELLVLSLMQTSLCPVLLPTSAGSTSRFQPGRSEDASVKFWRCSWDLRRARGCGKPPRWSSLKLSLWQTA